MNVQEVSLRENEFEVATIQHGMGSKHTPMCCKKGYAKVARKIG